MTAIAMTPLDFVFWGSTNPVTAELLRQIRVDSLAILRSGVVTLILRRSPRWPCAAGALAWPTRLLKPVRVAGAAGLSRYDAKAVSVETGIQNVGFGLVLVFQFFGGLGGMALIVGWWGVWHSISALALALWWARAEKLSGPRLAAQAAD